MRTFLIGVFLMCMVCLPIGFGSIVMTSSQPRYNVGDSVGGNVIVSHEEDIDGSLRVDAVCSNRFIEMFNEDISVKAGEEVSMILGNFEAESWMDMCYLSGMLKDGNTVLEQSKTTLFRIGRDLDVELDEEEFYSGDSGKRVVISGSVVNNLDKKHSGDVVIEIKNYTFKGTATDGQFSVGIDVLEEWSLGMHEGSVRVTDTFKNKGEVGFLLNVTNTTAKAVDDSNVDDAISVSETEEEEVSVREEDADTTDEILESITGSSITETQQDTTRPIDGVTGAVSGSDGLLSKNGVVAPLVLVLLICFLVWKYQHKKRDDKKNPPNRTEEIFGKR